MRSKGSMRIMGRDALGVRKAWELWETGGVR